MSDERRKILDMLAQGKITAEEAEKLLAAVAAPEASEPEDSSAKPGFKYLRVLVEPGPGSETQERVNIRVPFKLIRAGLKWAAFVPQAAQKQVNDALKEKGIEMDFSKIKPEDLEELVSHLNDLQVEVEGKEKIRIFCE
jgi:Asp-tRNA(Asn)/Glu-tRNA(Gln) amidotransferase B subunit